jgi:hypothetical protein
MMELKSRVWSKVGKRTKGKIGMYKSYPYFKGQVDLARLFCICYNYLVLKFLLV